MAENDSITISKQDVWKYSTFVLLAVLVIGAIYFFSNSSGGNTTGNVINPPTQGGVNERVEIDTEGAPVKGNANAEVTIVEFSDYECPFCGRHFLQTYPQIVKNYIDTGKAKLVFKDFPLSFHPEAQKAAEAAEAVKAQLGDEGYWRMHDKLFQNQDSLSVENYKKWAREIGVNGAQFDKDLDSGKYEDLVTDDFAQGQSAGVSGTPAFFINGNPIVGACPYSTFKSAIDAELAGQEWSVDSCQITIN